ncbi:MAG: hypothetical protein HMLIMOIP_002672 [Candidatus Nitrosomirales archaeon]|jgi:hypothetical protein
MGCIACGRGFHPECETGCDKCHSNEDRVIKSFVGRGAPIKDPEKVTDPYSTGRKRAAIQYPLFSTNPCEWRGKKNCGGGEPIVGCVKGKQQARHHGPIKDPLRNEPGNVHRICTACHNRWHAVNDSIYDEKAYEKLPHSPEEATELELLANESYWKLKK